MHLHYSLVSQRLFFSFFFSCESGWEVNLVSFCWVSRAKTNCLCSISLQSTHCSELSVYLCRDNEHELFFALYNLVFWVWLFLHVIFVIDTLENNFVIFFKKLVSFLFCRSHQLSTSNLVHAPAENKLTKGSTVSFRCQTEKKLYIFFSRQYQSNLHNI